eukprot:2897842-Prymnesium_polylepis.1
MAFVADAWASLFRGQSIAPGAGLRAISLLWVLLFHSFLLSERSAYWEWAVPLSGDMAVDLFLVLSGFLLGGSMIKELERGTPANQILWPFYVRRWFRIDPAFASAMALWSVVDAGGRERCAAIWWSNLSFMSTVWPKQNTFTGGWVPACMVHTWSVAVEFHMYLITPPLLFLGRALGQRWSHRVSAARCYLLVLSLAWAAAVALRFFGCRSAVPFECHYDDSPYRVAPYLCGLAAAVAAHKEGAAVRGMPDWAWWLGHTCSMAVLAVAAVFGAEPMYFFTHGGALSAFYRDELLPLYYTHMVIGRPLVGAAAAFLLSACTLGRTPCLNAVLSAPMWRPIAALSYSMYLLQVRAHRRPSVARWFDSNCERATCP